MFNWFKNKENEPKKGDIIVCIDDRNWDSKHDSIKLIYSKTYKLLDITYCFTCKTPAYDIGCRMPDKLYTECSLKHVLAGAGIHWAAARRFRKATPEEEKQHNTENKENFQASIEQLVAEERYEEAAELQRQQ